MPENEKEGTCQVPECQDGSIRLPYIEKRPEGEFVMFRWYECGECNGHGTASGTWERRHFPAEETLPPGAWQHTCMAAGDEATCPGCIAAADANPPE